MDVESAGVGQDNGLAVYQPGDFSFGKPSRITAKTFLGRAGIIRRIEWLQPSLAFADSGLTPRGMEN